MYVRWNYIIFQTWKRKRKQQAPARLCRACRQLRLFPLIILAFVMSAYTHTGSMQARLISHETTLLVGQVLELLTAWNGDYARGSNMRGKRVVHRHANHVPGRHSPRISQYQNQTVGRALGHVSLTATRWMIDGNPRQTHCQSRMPSR